MTIRALRHLLLALWAGAALAGSFSLGAGCSTNNSGPTPCIGASCGTTPDAGVEDACPGTPPTVQGECALSPVVQCDYFGSVCQGGRGYYCSGYHWAILEELCDSGTGPLGACPVSEPVQGQSCDQVADGTECTYPTACEDAGTVATCAGVWTLQLGACGFQGSPLCGIPLSGGDCDPDMPLTPGLACPTGPDAGAGPGGDAGEAGVDAGAPDAASGFACRVFPSEDAGVAPGCALAGSGLEGASCTTGQNCAAGFECVRGSTGKGVCRQYCCENECASVGDAGATPAFCDIEPMNASPTTAVPVCLQAPSCALFQACSSPSQTCTIVDAMGTTACVAVGPQQVGESCEQAHCGAGMTCFGTFPARTCVELCDATNVCPEGETCQSNFANFGTTSDPSAGICLQMP